MLFGSDWPFSFDTVVSYFTSLLDSYPQLDEAGHVAINRADALQLFPRLAPVRT